MQLIYTSNSDAFSRKAESVVHINCVQCSFLMIEGSYCIVWTGHSSYAVAIISLCNCVRV